MTFIEVRCQYRDCDKVLLEVSDNFLGLIRAKCRRCKRLNIVSLATILKQLSQPSPPAPVLQFPRS